ncbi:hypothetical protein AWENTII_007345 [Aspergillus wentii]
MFGHVDSWVPRLSFSFYAQSVEQRFGVLESVEDLTAAYEEAFQKETDTRTMIDQGISKMADAQKEAQDKIDLLTSPNGPLVNGVHKISFLTEDMEAKRQVLVKKLKNIQFTRKDFDWSITLDAGSLLLSTSLSLKYFLDETKKGYEIYQKATDDSTAKNLKGDAVREEYIIDNFSVFRNATKDDIKKILREFKNAIVEESRKAIESALDDFITVTLDRKPLMVKIAHSGNETLESTEGQGLEFSHDTVNIQFEYNTANVHTPDDFSTSVVFGMQGLENDWSGGDTPPIASTFAATGPFPFTRWRFTIRESENVGLDMGSVTAANVEFRGANRPFSVDYQKA